MADYGTTTGVLAYTRHLLEGYDRFNSETRPTATEVAAFLEDASACLNVALAGAGLTTPVTSPSTAVTFLDQWAERQAVEFVKATQIVMAHSGDSKKGDAKSLQEMAADFIESAAQGLKVLGVAVTRDASDGLTYTGLPKHSQRTDPDLATTREQPIFRRRKFDSP